MITFAMAHKGWGPQTFSYWIGLDWMYYLIAHKVVWLHNMYIETQYCSYLGGPRVNWTGSCAN